jgi:hypothetical protein
MVAVLVCVGKLPEIPPDTGSIRGFQVTRDAAAIRFATVHYTTL